MAGSIISTMHFNVKYSESPNDIGVELYGTTIDDGKTAFYCYDLSLSDLPIPTHPNLIFDGWYASDTYEEQSKLYDNENGQLIYPKNSSDVQVYAKWKSIPVYLGSLELFEIADAIREKTNETNEIMLNDMKDKIVSIDTGMKIETCTLKINNGTGGLKTICGIKFENDDITYFKVEDSSYNTSIIIENVLCNSVVMFEFVGSGSIYEVKNCTIIHETHGRCGAIYLDTPANGIVEIKDYNQK